MSKNEIRTSEPHASFIDAVTSNVFGGLHDMRAEVTQAAGSAVVAGETVARAGFGLARIALARLDAIGAALVGEGERVCVVAIGLLRRAGREVPNGVADIIAGGPSREVIAPRPSA